MARKIAKERLDNPELQMYGLMKRKMTDDEIDAQDENKKRAERLSGGFNPALVRTNEAVALTNDYHLTYYDRVMEKRLYKAAEEFGIKKLFVIGDFWDCEGYKNEQKYVNLTWFEAFQDEKKEAAALLTRMLENFKTIYFCRGNHEFRWIRKNRGMVAMDELFATTKVKGNYHVSLDDHMVLEQKGERWLLIHPKDYNATQLVIAGKIADKAQCNVVCAHGHQLARGFNKTGEFRLVDNGGLFDPDQIEYLRRTTTFPSVKSGFNVLMDNCLLEYAGRGLSNPFAAL